MKKTDNSYFNEKVSLRIIALEIINRPDVYVLDCYAGKGMIWNQIKKFTKKNLHIISIEKEKGKNKLAICGDNLKVMKSLDLTKFDVIDLDAYGIPYAQLKEIFNQNFKGIVFVTAIQSGIGNLPKGMLEEIGYTRKMMSKIQTIFTTKGVEKLKNYLYLHGVNQIEGYFIDRKNYFFINLNPKK